MDWPTIYPQSVARSWKAVAKSALSYKIPLLLSGLWSFLTKAAMLPFFSVSNWERSLVPFHGQYWIRGMPQKFFRGTLVYLINVLHNLIIFWKNPTYTPLFHPSRVENFQAKIVSIVVIFGKFQPARPYSILHVYWFWYFFHHTRLFHPAWLLDRLEYLSIRCGLDCTDFANFFPDSQQGDYFE